jgi:hypothetical protein
MQNNSETNPSNCRCGMCGRDCSGETTYPGPGDHDICQDCWEQWSDRQWWDMVKKLDELGLV